MSHCCAVPLLCLSVFCLLFIHVEWNIVAEKYKMASSLVDVASFPPEIISKIAQFLPLQDVLKCMLVCKSWKVSNSNNYRLCECRSYFNTWYTYVGGYQDLQILIWNILKYYRPVDSSTVLCNPSAWNFQFIPSRQAALTDFSCLETIPWIDLSHYCRWSRSQSSQKLDILNSITFYNCIVFLWNFFISKTISGLKISVTDRDIFPCGLTTVEI